MAPLKADADPVTPVAGTAVAIIPAPAHLQVRAGEAATLGPRTIIKTHPLDDEARRVGSQFAEFLRTATGYRIPVGVASEGDDHESLESGGAKGAIVELSTRGGDALGEEGYTLNVKKNRILIKAHTAEGLFRGVTTLRQLLPRQIESAKRAEGPWTIPAVRISDAPRYEYRGAMLDVARRFFEVADVKRFIDYMAMYKLNALHMHLTDDQGWRLTVDGRPALTQVGASTQSGWKPGTGGPWYYTKAQYREIVEYAAARFVDVIPEIDGPGHATAAKASLPEVNCGGQAPPPYFGFDVGLPPVCLSPEARPAVKAYLTDVLREAAQQSSADIVHIGGDEVPSTTTEQMDWYVRTAGEVVTAQHKRVMGWHQIGAGTLPPGSLLQWWGDRGDQASIGTGQETGAVRDLRAGVAQGARVIASPADRAYLDMKYDSTNPYGLSWAGLVNLRRAYEWDPVSATSSTDGTHRIVSEEQVAGVEAPLWTDRAYRGSNSLPTSLNQFVPPSVYTDFMTYPRLPAIAEVGWSSAEARSYDEFQRRVVTHGQRWDVQGIGYYRAPDVPWAAVS
ncbi:beta-N-acetylhexosaminidase [Streptosporangium sp. CA-135522]|uniref:beta-N-acetylhexosaminidase n=1 Tax=Streptosporangium sp. CA-135522 TaxID=3240072 RepID=UPI003D915B02